MTLESRPEPPHENAERDPDGVPADIVLRSAFAACALAFACFAMLDAIGWPGGVLVGVAAIPIMTISLTHKADRERARNGSVNE